MRAGFSIILILLVVCLNGQRKYLLPDGVSGDQIDTRWIIVKLKNETTLAADVINEYFALKKKTDTKPSVLDGMCRVKVKKGEDPIHLINQLLKDPNVIYAEPILNYQPLYAPSDPENSTNQSYLDVIQAYDAWEITRGDDDITIGIIDTGLDLDHEDLSNSIWTNDDDPIDGLDNDANGYIDDFYGYDFADVDNDPNADGGKHGVRVGGVAGADTDNGVGISGVGFNTKIAALKGFTTIGTTSNNLFEAILYGADNGMQVLNLSWGSLRDGLQSEQDIIDYAVLEKNVVVVAAAGNTDVDGKFYPASYNHVLSVGATNIDDSKWSFSTYNYSVDIMAPGTGIYSTETNDSYGTDNGTSYSAPMVAGAAALVMAQFPDLSALQVMEQLRVSADNIYDVASNSFFDGKLGLGRLNVFNAVSLSGLKSLRTTEFSTQTSLGNTFFFGDTVTVQAKYTSYLDALSDPVITISSPDNNFIPVQSTIMQGSISTLAQDSISFDIVMDTDLQPEVPVNIRLDYQDGTYTDFQFLETTSSPDYYDFGTDLKLTVAGAGNLAFADASFQNGLGIEFKGDTILEHAGLMIADSETTVSNNFVSDYVTSVRDQDFGNHVNFKLKHHPQTGSFGYSEFQDVAKNLIIEQSVFSPENSDYIILRYRIVNNSATAINDLSVGLFSDFDLGDKLENRAEHEAAQNYMVTQDMDGTTFAGTKVIANGTVRYSALDTDTQNGNSEDVPDTFTDALKYEFLRNQQIGSAGSLGNGNDVAMMNGVTFTQINGFESEFFTVIIAAADTKNELETLFTNAEAELQLIIENPEILGSTFSCESSMVTLDPEGGDNFQFFQDAAGTILLHDGTSFETGAIDKDTVFYLRNTDGAYPSALYQYQVSLLADLAGFSISPDTLYLDNPTNVVSFQDESFNAISWNWDFGENTTSTIQNPMLSFAQAGNYTITLSIENDAGCLDTEVKTLVVADRPQSPSFSTFTICPGDMITLSDPMADELQVFETETSSSPLYTGSDIMAGPFNEQTTLWVSGVYSQFESLRTTVQIEVNDFPVDINVEIDTLSTTHQIIARAQTDETITDWLVNGLTQGSAGEITIPSGSDLLNITLTAQNTAGCTISDSVTFSFSGSQIPSQEDVTFCEGETAVIRPGNGQVFGFYNDESLTDLIKKGTELVVTDQTKVFIAGLDDGLPGTPIEVNISFDDFDPEIISSSEVVSNQNKVTLSSSLAEEIAGYKWYIDGTLTETASNPSIILDNERFEVVLEAVNLNGCTKYDTTTLDFIPPLGLADTNEFLVYPNPGNGLISLVGISNVSSISVWDISGKKLSEQMEPAERIDLTWLAAGIYIIKAQTQEGSLRQTLIIQKD